jgi:hypothetical protein
MPSSQGWLSQMRGLRTGFMVGLLVGMLVGWFFHGLVGLAVRLGFAAVLLIPLAIVIWFFFFRQGRQASRPNCEGEANVRMYTWGSGRDATASDRVRRRAAETNDSRRQRDSDIIDLEFEELKRELDDDRGQRS